MWIEKTLSTKNVWFAKLEDIVQHLEDLKNKKIWSPSVEKLPIIQRKFYRSSTYNAK